MADKIGRALAARRAATANETESAPAARRAAAVERRSNRNAPANVSGTIMLAHVAAWVSVWITITLSLLLARGSTFNWNLMAYHAPKVLLAACGWSYLAQKGRRRLAWGMAAFLVLLIAFTCHAGLLRSSPGSR